MFTDLMRRTIGKSPTRRLDATITAFLACYENLSTRKTYGKVLRPFAELVGPERALAAITPEDIDAWYQHQPVTTLAVATMAKRMKAVKVFWNWCVKREYVARSPARFLVIRRPQRIMVSKAIPSDVLAAMFKSAQQKHCVFVAVRDTALLALLITFGVRVGEVAHLKMSDVYLEAQQILFRGKGDKERILPLPQQTGRHVADWLELRTILKPDPDHDYLFANIRTQPGMRHGPLVTGSIATMVRRLSMAVSDGSYGPHAIRGKGSERVLDRSSFKKA